MWGIKKDNTETKAKPLIETKFGKNHLIWNSAIFECINLLEEMPQNGWCTIQPILVMYDTTKLLLKLDLCCRYLEKDSNIVAATGQKMSQHWRKVIGTVMHNSVWWWRESAAMRELTFYSCGSIWFNSWTHSLILVESPVCSERVFQASPFFHSSFPLT